MQDLSKYRRSNEPIFWGLFGFGGMAIAFAFPALIGAMIYAGIAGEMSYFHFYDVIGTLPGALAAFLLVFGASFHVMHRIYFSVCDFKFRPGLIGKIICYGVASLLSLAALVLLTAVCLQPSAI